MEKQPTTPITIPGKAESPTYSSAQYSSCLTKLYGMSPDMKVSPETYMQWCREQQELIDELITQRDLEQAGDKKE